MQEESKEQARDEEQHFTTFIRVQMLVILAPLNED